MSRPRLLLIPVLSELEWTIRPQLEEWAEVASYDPPGVGDEPPIGDFDTAAIIRRGAIELERRRWERCVFVADEYATASALRLAMESESPAIGLALGHATLSLGVEGDRPALNREVEAAFRQVAELDHRTYMRHLTQITQGFYGEELTDRMLDRIPPAVGQAYQRSEDPDRGGWIGEALSSLGLPLLLAEHDPCLLFTKEGYEDAVAAFPEARTVACREKPSTSPAFGEALREFCEGIGADG